ncbi:integrase, catalytic region, zinc finger, CCHC-type containing protein [Tanacetum coccineum]
MVQLWCTEAAREWRDERFLKFCKMKRKVLFPTPRTVKYQFDNTTPVVSKTRFSVKTVQSKYLDTTPVVSKTKIVVVTPLSAKYKVSSAFKIRDNSLSSSNCLWIVNSGYSNHMIGDRSLLKNFVEKFMGTIRFRNDPFAAITGYGDYLQGNIIVCHVYYVEGLEHNLFSVIQFYDGDRESNLYTISISDMAASSPVCLISKATLTKSWLWHRRLLHLNFGTINNLTKHDLVDGLPKLKYRKDHLCSAEQESFSST